MQLKLIATLAIALVTQANAHLLERQTTTECCIPGGYSCDIVNVDPPLIKCCASFECIGATTNDTVGVRVLIVVAIKVLFGGGSHFRHLVLRKHTLLPAKKLRLGRGRVSGR
ncbi:hypothetical protein K438DRAFT_1774598 [Mycena galopus ATCC 62051]|nr:hypothetical protein K438DRAFT_1774598 [Mycena galopus ATCC 62051]